MRASIEQLLCTSSLGSFLPSPPHDRVYFFFLTVPCSVCDGFLQSARQYHIRYYASSDYCGPACACYRWSCTREPRYGAPCARGRPGRRPTDLRKQRKCGRRCARTAREAAFTKREHEEGRHRKYLQGLGRGKAQRRGLLRGDQPGRSTATSTKGTHSQDSSLILSNYTLTFSFYFLFLLFDFVDQRDPLHGQIHASADA